MAPTPVKNMNDHASHRLPDERRNRIFQTGAAEFATHGFRGASLNRIIDAVGMRKSSFYHYFRNKQDLFMQILNDAMQPILSARSSFDLARLNRDNFWPMIATMADELSKMAESSPQMITVGRMFYRCHENPDERMLTQEIMQISTDWLKDLIDRGQRLGLLRRDLPEGLIIDMVMSLAMSMDRWFLEHWDQMDDRQRRALNDKAMDLFRRLLAPRPDDDSAITDA